MSEVDPSPPKGEQTTRTRLAAVENGIERIERRTHPARALVVALAALVTVVAGGVTAIEHVATKSYVDARLEPFVRDHDLMLEMVGWQRAIGQALGVRPAPITLPQPRNPDGGTP